MFLFNSKLSQTILSHVFHMITKLFFSVEKNENKINIFFCFCQNVSNQNSILQYSTKLFQFKCPYFCRLMIFSNMYGLAIHRKHIEY